MRVGVAPVASMSSAVAYAADVERMAARQRALERGPIVPSLIARYNLDPDISGLPSEDVD